MINLFNVYEKNRLFNNIKKMYIEVYIIDYFEANTHFSFQKAIFLNCVVETHHYDIELIVINIQYRLGLRKVHTKANGDII